MTENERERLARRYAAGEITWRGLCERDFDTEGRVTTMQNNGWTASLIALVVLASCATQVGPGSLDDVYEASIAAAAVKRPDYARPLKPIDMSKPEVTVAHMQSYPTIDTRRFVWVTQPDELKDFCRDKPDPLLALQQALGLPPEKRDDVRVFTFDVRPMDMFRPCASSPDIGTPECSIDMPEQPSGTQEYFVLKQMMGSYRSGFKGPGHPFTAMGWSYDWDPQSLTHQGVSEYVVKPGSLISHVTAVDPGTFCETH